MVENGLPARIAAAWRPQRPGRRGPRDIHDAIVEPEWGGVRVVAALTIDRAGLFREGVEVAVPEELLEALLDGFSAIDAVVEGNLTTAAFQTGEGAFPDQPKIDRAPLIVPRVFRSTAKDDPFIHAREHEAELARHAPVVIEALADGERHAFVATDLLWLDGEPIDQVPLLERRRLLESVIGESYLIRISTFVRPTDATTLVSWRTLGFEELSYRASNSRYLPGEVNSDWAIAKAPDAPTPQPLKPPPR